MAPNGWFDGIKDAANRILDQLQGSSGYKFEISLGRSEPVLKPWVIVVIALVALVLLVWLVVRCCRCFCECCCPSEPERVLIVRQPTPEPQVVTQYVPMSSTSLMMQLPGAAATHGAGVYSENAKSSSSAPPSYDQEVLLQSNYSHKYTLPN